MINQDNSYSLSDECLRPLNNLEGSLNTLKTESISIAKQIMDEIYTLSRQSGAVDSQINSQQTTLDTETNNLNQKRTQINQLKNEINALESSIENNRINVGSINLRYMTWGVSFATLVILTMLVSKK